MTHINLICVKRLNSLHNNLQYGTVLLFDTEHDMIYVFVYSLLNKQSSIHNNLQYELCYHTDNNTMCILIVNKKMALYDK